MTLINIIVVGSVWSYHLVNFWQSIRNQTFYVFLIAYLIIVTALPSSVCLCLSLVLWIDPIPSVILLFIVLIDIVYFSTLLLLFDLQITYVFNKISIFFIYFFEWLQVVKNINILCWRVAGLWYIRSRWLCLKTIN